MKLLTVKLLGFLSLWFFVAGTGNAANLEALDRVSVKMDRAAVKSLLGTPDMESRLSIGLEADVYHIKGLKPLIGKGCVYSDQNRLVGQAFVFEGLLARAVVSRLAKNGFHSLTHEGGVTLLEGKDDDTGLPIMVSVSEKEGLTTVVTFEEEFYRETK